MLLRELRSGVTVADYDAVEYFLNEMFDARKLNKKQRKRICKELVRYINWWVRENCEEE